MHAARDNKGHLKVCLILILKVNYRGQITNDSQLEISNIGYIQIENKNDPVSHIQPIMNKGHNK